MLKLFSPLQRTTEVVKTLGSSYVPAYLDSIKSYNNPDARITLGGKNANILTTGDDFSASSIFMALHLLHMDENNLGLFPNKTKPVTRQDLEKKIAEDDQFLKKQHTDFGVAIWPEPPIYKLNKLIHEILIKQFKQRRIKLDRGKLIYLSGLAKPREHPESPPHYGLVLDLKDISTRDLKKSIIDLSEIKWNGSRGFGIARAGLCNNCEWYSENYDIENFSRAGRIVGVGLE